MWRLALLACVLAAAAYVALRREPAGRPNVLVVTIDTLRPDAVGKGRSTPAIDAFFSEATVFPRTRTVAPITLAAHASILTGLFPSSHGIHDNVTEPLPPPERRGFPLVAEQFRDRGYRTAAFVACAVLSPATGLASGFDVYDCPPVYKESETGYVPAETRIAAALEWMGKAPPGKPWFVWVHLYDPHAPYRPFPGDATRPASREGEPVESLYAGEVRRADAAFGKLLAAAGPDTVVVLASDHGESFREHDEVSHGPLCYGTTVDAVLAVRGPGLRRGAVDTGLRSVADVAPTLARLCGLVAHGTDGRDLAGPPHETLVAESLYTWRAHNWGQCFSVTDGDFTLVESGPRLELFDRRRDPGETVPQSLAHPAYEKLDRALEAFRAQATPAHDGEVFTSVPAYGQLRRRALGYLPRHENRRLPDPRAHMRTWLALQSVPSVIQLALARRDPVPLQQALQVLTQVALDAPTSPRVPYCRAQVCAALADLTRDASWLYRAAWAQIDAIGKGYVERDVVLPAITYAVAANDADALRAIIRLLERDGRKPDAETARALAEASAALRLDARAPVAFSSDG
jgi:arylsulfatase A-like enzyme